MISQYTVRARWCANAYGRRCSQYITWRQSICGAFVVNAFSVLRDRRTCVLAFRCDDVLGRFDGGGGAADRRCGGEWRSRKMAPTRVILMSCGSYNPPTNMHLRMFGKYISIRRHFSSERFCFYRTVDVARHVSLSRVTSHHCHACRLLLLRLRRAKFVFINCTLCIFL